MRPFSLVSLLGFGAMEFSLIDSHQPGSNTNCGFARSWCAVTFTRTWKISPLRSRAGAVTAKSAASVCAEVVVGR